MINVACDGYKYVIYTNYFLASFKEKRAEREQLTFDKYIFLRVTCIYILGGGLKLSKGEEKQPSFRIHACYFSQPVATSSTNDAGLRFGES